MNDSWKPIESAPNGISVMTKIDDEHGSRNEQKMIKSSGMWWINWGTPSEMYVYYKPTHWKPLGDKQ